jgi:dipeptidyl-peptidase-4
MTGAALVPLALLAGPLSGQPAELERLTLQAIHSRPSPTGAPATDIVWHPKGKRLTYLRKESPETPADLWSLEVAKRRSSKLVPGLGSLLPPPNPGRRPRYQWSPRGKSIAFLHEGDVTLVDTGSGRRRKLTRTPEPEEFPEFSPDGKRIAFVRENDLYFVEVASGRETRLTKSGSDTVLNGRLDWAYWEELGSRHGKAFAWAPNSRAIAYLQLDQASVPEFPIVDFLPARNTVDLQRYPRPGDPISRVRLGVIGLEKGRRPGPERLLSIEPADSYVVPGLSWTRNSRTLAFRQLNRAQNRLELRFLPVPKSVREPLGAPLTVLVEEDAAWVNALDPPHFLKRRGEFLWRSERDGFAHIYRCDETGRRRAVTRGRWTVERLVAVDERRGFVYFTATEKHPRERHLYRARLDGTGFARLTRTGGTHRASLSSRGDFWVDSWSNVDTPTAVSVVSVDGKHRYALEPNAAPTLSGYELGTTEWVDLEAADGTQLHARLMKPRDFDPTRRYPVVVYVYGGPHGQTVTDAWRRRSLFEHLLVSRGFLLWSLDNRGTAGRGHAFERPVYRDLGRVELEDQLVGIEYLRALPYVDAERMGIWGWSYGGYMTLYAITRVPQLFKAAVAGAPVTDWRFYDAIYTERYMGSPSDNAEGYDRSAPLTRAGDVETELLLIHGAADDNVHLANTMAFVHALNGAGRPHSLVVHPGQKHGFRERTERIARDAAILRHFENHLLN